MKGDHFLIRNYRPGDFKAVSELWEETGMGSKLRADSQDVIKRTLDLGGKLLIMSELLTDTLVGTSWLTHDGRRAYLHHFCIKPAFQGRKLSHRLLRETLMMARETGLQIKLEVHRTNQVAAELYRKAGFKRLGDYDVYIIRDLNEIVL